jgi:hypothetical protein
VAESTVRVNFVGDAKDLNRAIDQVDHKAGGLSTKLGGLSRAAGVGLAGAAVVGGAALWSMAQSAAEDEKQAAALAKTLENVTGATKEQSANLEKWISKQGKAFGVADDKLRPALDSLVRGFGDVDAATEMATLAMDISAGTGKDLTAVSDALSKAYNGQLGPLKKLDPALADLVREGASADEVFGALSRTFEGQAAAAAETTAGKLEIAKIQFAEMQEEIGAKVIPVLADLATWLVDDVIPALERLSAWIEDEVVPVLKDMAAWINEHVVPVVKDMARIFVEDVVPALMITVAVINDEIIPRVQSLTKFWIELGTKVYEIVVGAATLIGNLATTISGFATDIKNALGDIFQPIIDAVRPAVEEALRWLDKLLGPIDEILGKVAKLPKVGSSKDLFERVEAEQQRRAGGRASGGAVSAGMTYTVGEKGPELLTMGGSGFITPNHRLGGAPTVNIYMPPGSDGDDVVRAIRNWERRNGPLGSN